MNWLQIVFITLCVVTSVLGACEYAKYGSDHTMCKYKGYGCDISKRGMSQKDADNIVKVHNDFRQKIARGVQKEQPKASNMKQLEWDDELSTIVQRLVDQCKDENDSNRRSHKYSWTGQNLYLMTSAAASSPNFTKAVEAWYNEVSLFNPKHVQDFNLGSNTSHYTQLAWAETEAVGCGYASFWDNDDMYNHLIGCNYGPGGNYNGVSMYEVGEPCSTCPTFWYCSTEYSGLCN